MLKIPFFSNFLEILLSCFSIDTNLGTNNINSDSCELNNMCEIPNDKYKKLLDISVQFYKAQKEIEKLKKIVEKKEKQIKDLKERPNLTPVSRFIFISNSSAHKIFNLSARSFIWSRSNMSFKLLYLGPTRSHQCLRKWANLQNEISRSCTKILL